MQIKKGFWIVLFITVLSACTSTPFQIKQDQAAAARLKLGLAYLAQSQSHPEYLDLAYRNLQIAEKHAPGNPYVLFGLAQFYQQIGDSKTTKALYQRLIKEKRDQGIFLIYYGRFLCQQGQYIEAQRQFDRVKTLNHYQWQVDALEQSAYCALFEPNLTKAKTQFNQLFLLAPSKRTDAKNMISFYQKKGKTTEAKNLSVIIK